MALRPVLNVDSYYSPDSVHTYLNQEWLYVARQRHCCNMAYKAINNIAPPNSNAVFAETEQTRCVLSSKDISFVSHLNKLTFEYSNLPTRCYAYWKNVPPTVKASPLLKSSKTNLKKSNCFPHDHSL